MAAGFVLAAGALRAGPITDAPVLPGEVAHNRVLLVGPNEELPLPSSAAVRAHPGDIIRILPGRYADCSIWYPDGLIIEGIGEVVISAEGCLFKGAFVIAGNNVTVRGLTFTGARNPVHNGAGIRAEGANLMVENSRFIDNEEGILAAGNPASTIIVRGSYFRGNGTCAAACAHGIYAGLIARLRVEHCVFVAQRVGHNIKSRAQRTEIVDNRIEDGAEGTSSYLLDIPNGGAVLVRGNRFQKGPLSQNRGVAIAIGAEMDSFRNPAGPIEIDNNRLANEIGSPTVFVRNDSDVPARLQGNRFKGAVTPLMGAGTVDGETLRVR